MGKICKGFYLIGTGLLELGAGVMGFCIGKTIKAGKKAVKAVRRWKLKRATAYVARYGYELGVNDRVKVAGKAYYVMSYESYSGYDDKREVRLNLIGVPQYREMVRRLKQV